MKEDLVRSGVPAGRIYRDFAGFRTLDSVVRANRIFQQQEFTIISQRFHNKRAVFLAKHYKLDAIGFDARDVGFYSGLKTKIREKAARTKAVLDILVGTKPKFLGPTIEVGKEPAN
jgi:SanA protein